MEVQRNSFRYLFADTVKALFKQSARELANAGIQILPEQHFLLHLIASKEETIQSDLAEMIHKDKSAVMRHIDQLEAMDYLIRVNDTTDRRKKHLVITEAGKDIMKQCQEVIDVVTERNLVGITEEELEVFTKVLIKLKQNSEK
ncbi:MarR family transcriptional regulator [Flectobacillus sp. DC10W]|uniref:MarR family transcriptional regulator n=1 Tax=Flectobacillus longus TaxID=2984207 RepID=A0ABT6YUK2_9BACT|nr:MarR family transcriptional regulator [Flectobacillus longus]MDI9866788.1 MarR family transcriptional regulator [Flectobacillus longus]